MWNQEDLSKLYKAIYHRKSVRKFQPEPVEPAMLEELEQALSNTETPLPGGGSAFRVLGADQIKGIISAKAPHYLTLYAPQGEQALVAAAFRLQQMDLWLSANGLGACWLGMPSPKGEHAQTADGMPYVITLAFGKPAEPSRRQQPAEFKRKAQGEITDIAGKDKLLEAVRLAPSATNRQPWYLTAEGDKIHLHAKRNNAITKKLLGDMPMMDSGIALCHLWLSAVSSGIFEAFVHDPVGSPSGYGYVWSVRMK